MWQHKCHFIEGTTGPSMIAVPPASMAEGAASTYEGVAHAIPLQDPVEDAGPLPQPLPLEPWAQLQEDIEEMEEFHQVPDEEPALPVDEQVVYPLPQLQVEVPPPANADATVHQSNCTKRPSRQLQEHLDSHMVQVMESIMFKDDDSITSQHPLLALAMSNDPDILMLREAMAADDSVKFQEGMVKEFNDHCDRQHWVFVLRNLLPSGTKVLPSVWAMCHKRRIATGEIYKWKARLNIHGGKQVKGIHYWGTYSPMVCWASISLALTLSMLHGWFMAQMDFVLAYPQVDIEVPLFMKMPKGFVCEA